MGLPWGCGGLSVEDMIFGYARCSTVTQDVEVQRRQLVALGVDPDRIMVDLGYSAVAKHRPGLDKVLGMLREGDAVVVTKLDRLARSVVDAHEIAQCIDRSGAKLQIGSSVHDPLDPMGKMMFSVLAMVAEFERDLISMRTKEGLALAREAGRLKGKSPKLSPEQDAQVLRWLQDGTMTQAEMAKILGVAPSTISRARKRLLQQLEE